MSRFAKDTDSQESSPVAAAPCDVTLTPQDALNLLSERPRRRETLAQMVRDGEEMGLYEATDGVPPRMR